jgi:hypothetical protein
MHKALDSSPGRKRGRKGERRGRYNIKVLFCLLINILIISLAY